MSSRFIRFLIAHLFSSPFLKENVFEFIQA